MCSEGVVMKMMRKSLKRIATTEVEKIQSISLEMKQNFMWINVEMESLQS